MFGAFADDLYEVSFYVFEGHLVHELLDVDFLRFQVVRYAGEGVESAQVTGTHVLHVGDVVVDDFEQPGRFLGYVFYDILERLLVEGFADSGGVHCAHAVVGASVGVALDGYLHGETTVENDGD